MTTALIVGGDHIENIKQTLAAYGIEHITHWHGRKAGDSRKVIPQDTRLVVLVTDWVNHAFSTKVKKNAARQGVQVIYTPNTVGALQKRLSRLASHGLLTQE